MDDEQQTPFPQPGYHAYPSQTAEPTHPTPDATHQQPTPRRRRGRLVAGVAVTALVAGVAGAGAGYAFGHALGGSTTATASSGTAQAGTRKSGGVGSIPGNGWSGGGLAQGGTQLPTDPYAGGSGSGSTGSQGQSSDTTTTASGSQLTGLVRVTSTMKYASAKAAGTGMVLNSCGEVVTNHHVVEGATSVRVKVMSTGRSYVAKVVGTDAKDDIAVLQLVGASGLRTVTTGSSGAAVGDTVTAVGDANGTVTSLSAAEGEVMALRQSITTQNDGTATGERLTGLMEISSDVISGDSGGATYDSSGHVVGMTTAASSGGSDVVGYAVPIAKVLRVTGDLESGVTGARYDYGRPAFLGVGLGQTGTSVAGVYAATPAAHAGLAAGDTITAVDSRAVRTATRLHDAIAAHVPGDAVRITWLDTSGASHTATITLTSGPVA